MANYVAESAAEDITLRNMSREVAEAYSKTVYPKWKSWQEKVMADWARFQGMSDSEIFEYERGRALMRVNVA